MAVDFFLKLDGIEGESVDANFKNQVKVLSWSWGATQVSSVGGTGGSGAGKANLSDFSIMADFDKSTPVFFKSVAEGTHIKTGTMSAVKAGMKGKPYLKVDFKEMFVTSVQMSGSSEIPTVSVTFSYNEIKMDYSQQTEDGTATSTGAVTYNTKTNVSS